MGVSRVLRATGVAVAGCAVVLAAGADVLTSDTFRLSPLVTAVESSAALPPEVQSLESQSAPLAFDRDTQSVHTAFDGSKITVSLGTVTEIRALKIFGAAPYSLAVEAEVGGSYQPVAGLQDLNLATRPEAWNVFNVVTPVTTGSLRFTLTPATGGSASGLKAIEIWGRGGRVHVKDGLALLTALRGSTPPSHGRLYRASLDQGVIGGATDELSDNTFTVALDHDPRNFKRLYLAYESTGIAHWITAVRQINSGSAQGGFLLAPASEWTTQVEAVDPNAFVRGNNTVAFSVPAGSGGSYTVRNLYLVAELESGANFIASTSSNQPEDTNPSRAVVDGDLATGWTPYPNGVVRADAPTIILGFDKPTQLDGVALYLANTLKGSITVEVLKDGAWSAVGAAVDARKLIGGWNTLNSASATAVDGARLVFSGGQGSSAEIRELQPVGSGVGPAWAPDIAVSYPDNGQFYGRSAYLRGFVQPLDNGSGAATLTIGGQPVATSDGAFGVTVSKDDVGFGADGDSAAWSVELKAVYPNGKTVTRTVALNNHQPAVESTDGQLLQTYSLAIPPGLAKKINYDAASLELSAASLGAETTIGITPLDEKDLPALDAGMTNVTKGPRRGYRFTPHPMKFNDKVKVTLPYNKALIPAGLTEQDIKTFYFDDQAGSWKPLERAAIDTQAQTVTSLTDHFTDMINATVTVPDHPNPASFNPTSMKDIKAADPGSAINLIEPPQASNQGDARLSYPIEVPPGRQGMQPQLAISYSSGGSHSWIGQGWDLSVPSISIDTRWGVPRYSATHETETYTLNGEMLSPVAHRGALVARAADRTFHTRTEGQFRKIQRHGSDPTNYWWEVTEKNGTRHFYGATPSGQDAGAVLGGAKGVFKWMLRQTVDTNGNTVNYEYARVEDTGVGNGTVGAPGYQLYVSTIYYTGSGAANGPYAVKFVRDSANRRPDVNIDARGGFKQVTAELLQRIDVLYDGQVVRQYVLGYNDNPYGDGRTGTAFNKTLLTTITQNGAGGAQFVGNVHRFEYFDDIRTADGKYKGFGSPKQVDTGKDNLVYKSRGGSFPHTVIGGTEGTSIGADGYVGIGVGDTKMVSVGVGFGGSQAKSKGSNTFIDVDGDGLPDKVFLKGSGYYRANKTPTGSLDDVSFDVGGNATGFGGFANPSKTESSTSNISVQAFVVGLTGNGGTATTSTRDTGYLADVNGDGLTDLVSGGAVRFNAARSTGTPVFSVNSYDTDVPLGNIGGSVSKDVLPDVSEERQRLETENPLMDNVRRWVAPYDGTVRVSGGVRLIDFSTDPRFTDEQKLERLDYKQADGVRVAIQVNGQEWWHADIPQTLYDEQQPVGVDAIPVRKGDRILFRVQSKYDGMYDQVAWSPTVEYIDGGTTLTKTDANSANAYRFQAGEDFVYAGRPLELNVPYKGTLRLAGLLNKTAATTDDITLRVTVIDRVYTSDGTLVSETSKVALTRKFAWDYVGPVDLQEDFAVGKYSSVKIDLVVDSPIDLAVLKWGDLSSPASPRPGQPQLYYTVAYQDQENPLAPEITVPEETPTYAEDVKVTSTDGMAPILDDDNNPIEIPAKQLDVYDADGKPIYTMPVKFEADIYPKNALTAPQQGWIAPRDGVILWTPWVALKSSVVDNPNALLPDGSVVLTAKRHGARLAKAEVQIRNRMVVESSNGYNGVQGFKVKAGDEIFFDASMRDPNIEAALASATVRIHYASDQAWTAPITDSVDLLAHIAGTAPAQDPNSTEPVDGRAMFVVHRASGDVVAKEIVDFSVSSVVDLSHTRSVSQGDQLYFDVFTINPGVTVQTRQTWVRYTGTGSFSVPATGTLSIKPLVSFQSAAPDGSVTLTVLRNGASAAQQTYPVEGGELITSGVPALSLAVTAGETLTFAYSTADYALSGYLAGKGAVELDYANPAPPGWTAQTVGSASFTIAVPNAFGVQDPQNTVSHTPLNDPLFGNPYRGWATAAYNGNGSRAGAPVDESLLTMSSDPERYKYSTKLLDSWPALPAVESERWISQDDLWWTSPLEVSASRLGLDNVYDPKADDFTDGRGSGYAAAARPPKMSKTKQKVAGYGFVLSKTQSEGKATSQLDLVDMNGDRFPDVVGPGATQYTWADGTFFDTHGGSAARASKDEQTTIGFSVGVPTSRQGAIATILQLGDRQNSEPSSVSIGGGVSKGSNETNYDLVDVNGDGLPDRVVPAGNGLSVQLNTGYGFAAADTWTGGQLTRGTSKGKSANVGFSMWNGNFGGGVSVSENHNNTNVTPMDINGDGLTDIVTVGGAGVLTVWLNTGGGFTPIAWPGAPIPYKDLKTKAPGTMAVGDGASSSASGSVKFSFGFTVWFLRISFSFGINGGETVAQPSVAYNDINGDGFVDGVLTASDDEMQVYLNPIQRTNMLKTVKRPLGARFDMDYQRLGNTYTMPQSRYVLSGVTVFDGVADPVAGRTSDYQRSTYQYSDGVYDRFERDFYGFTKVVSTQLDTTGLTAANLAMARPYRRTTQTYRVDSVFTKGLLAEELTEDLSGNAPAPYTVTTNSYERRDVVADADGSGQTLTVFPALTRTDKAFYEGGKGVKTTYSTFDYDDFGNVKELIEAGDDAAGTADDVKAIIAYSACPNYVIEPISITVLGQGRVMRKREATLDCATGNVTQVRQLLETGPAAVTDLDYHGNGNLKTVTGPANERGQRYQLSYLYDPAVATHIAQITDSFGLSSSATYDLRYGKPDVTTDTNGNQTDYEYDDFGRIHSIKGPYEVGSNRDTIAFSYYPQAVVPYALTRHLDLDATGQTKASGTIDTILFTDGLKRVLQTKKDASVDADGNGSATDVMIVSGRVEFDGLGRTVTQYYPTTEPKTDAGGLNGTFRPDLPADSVAPTVTTYDVLDRTTRVHLPDTTETNMAYGFGPDRNGLNQFLTQVFDANGIEKRTYRNLRELITSVWETNKKGGQDNIWTSYTYDPLKQIVEVKDDRGHLTTVAYDNLGRRTVIDNPDTGRTETVYDPASNVTRKITAKLKAQGEGVAIAYSYDFNRLTTIAYPNEPQNTVAYTYGAPGAPDNRAGRITEVTDASGKEERFYGRLGELTKETRTVNSHTQGASATSPEVYTTSYRYDTFGRLLTLTYPDGELLTYAYDAGGNVATAAGKKGPYTYVYLKGLTYDRFEQRVRLESGNGIVTRYTYDPANRRLTNLEAGTGSGANRFQNLLYSYDKVGNVLGLQNDVPVVTPGQFGGPTTQAYVYDDLYRLTAAQGSYAFSPDKRRVYSYAQSYDTIHNILTKAQTDAVIEPSGVSTPQHKTSYSFLYTYEGKGPHAPSQIGERRYSYDLNGNQTGWEHEANGTKRTIVWDDDNRISSVSDNGKTSTYVYDDQGQRALKITPDGETAYINQYFTIRNRELGSKHVFIGTSRLTTKLMKQDKTQSNPKGATVFEKDQYFYHPDHLGSTGYVTDRTGKLYEHVEYFPFGETWVQEATNANNVPYLFTGKELDEETGLYYYGARYYDPRTSVWQSGDPALESYLPTYNRRGGALLANGVFDSSNLNMYAYAGLNPLRFVDPTGSAKEAPEIVVPGRAVEMQRFKSLERGNLNNVHAIVLHRTGVSNARSTLNAYGNGQPYGAHFLITEDGKIIQTASLAKQTQHVGNIRPRCLDAKSCSAGEKTAIEAILYDKKKPYSVRIEEISLREIKEKDYPDRNPSSRESIGIEVVGSDYSSATDEQKAAVKGLVGALQEKYGLGDKDVYAHGAISYKDTQKQEGANLGY